MVAMAVMAGATTIISSTHQSVAGARFPVLAFRSSHHRRGTGLSQAQEGLSGKLLRKGRKGMAVRSLVSFFTEELVKESPETKDSMQKVIGALVDLGGLVPTLDLTPDLLNRMGTPMGRWVSWDPVIQSLPNFLTDWKPASTLAPEVEWLCVSKLKAAKIETNQVHNLMSAWEQLCISKKDDVTCLDVDELARVHNVMSGKWLIFLPSKVIDDAWLIVANATVEGKLGNDAKVSTLHYVGPLHADVDTKRKSGKASDSKDSKKPEKSEPVVGLHVICVYATNFDDMEGVFELRQKLVNLGFKDKLLFKPDAYSFCGIYSQNRWGISPTIYCS